MQESIAATHPVGTGPPGGDLAAVLGRHAAQRGEQVACVALGMAGDEEARLTYAELDRRARAVAAVLQDGTGHGDRVLIVLPSGVDFFVAFFACAYAGMVAVPAPSPETLGGGALWTRLRSIAGDAKPGWVLTTAELADLGEAQDLGPGRWIAVAGVDPLLADVWRAPAGDDPRRLAFLQYTSGSTGEPKGVMVSHANVLANFAAMDGATPDLDGRAGPGLTTVTWLPLFHDLGLLTPLWALYRGGRAVVLPPAAFLLRPALWLRAMSDHAAVASAAPNFAYELCLDRAGGDTFDLSAVRYLFNGAEPVRANTQRRFAAAFAGSGLRPGALRPCYGLAEATVYVSGAREPGDPLTVEADVEALERDGVVRPGGIGGDRRELVTCGRVPGNIEVRVVDPHTRRDCPPGRVGELWVAGASVARGYWQREDERFGARLADGRGPFLRTGDLGVLHGGLVVIAGRADDVVVIDGRNVHPQDVEATAGTAHPALAGTTAAAFGYDDGGRTCLAVAVETARAHEVFTTTAPAADRAALAAAVVAAVRRAVATEHQLSVTDVVLLRPGGLPRTSSGKVRRRETRRLFKARALEAW
ncbi:fatty acyl-AMP ligase [Dactylosporangium sp. NPDC005555]|uniref:fatty acyl-AMP ligase n=1 Tax=Dactylosporangium sp. NPDC005555 TaxID=3154889 RepID=UPI0033B6EBB7